MCKNQRDLRVRLVVRVLCFEEGDERGPVLSREQAQIALKVSDSEHRPLVWLTQTIVIGLTHKRLRNPKTSASAW